MGVRSMHAFEWEKYDSSRLSQIFDKISLWAGESPHLPKNKVLLKTLVSGPLMAVVEIVMTTVHTMLLMGLFLAFLLLSSVRMGPRQDLLGVGGEVKRTVQQYVRIKVLLSAVVGCLVWFVYSQLKVDLAFVFALLTFLLNQIPQVGFTIAIIAPLPLVCLDPSKTFVDVLECFAFPLLIHQVFSLLVEPRLLSKSLDLHPIAVLAALG